MNKKVNFILPLCIAVSVLYIFLAIRPLQKELHFKTVWTVDSSKPNSSLKEISPQGLIPFKIGQVLGYFSSEGKIYSIKTYPYKASISKNDYCIYGSSDKKMEIFSSTDEKKGSINAQGFPFFQGEKKYLMLPGGNSFAFLDDRGKLIWQFENYVPITAFATSKSATAAGYADGSIITFNDDGKIESSFSPGGSEYPAVLGIAVSDDAKLTAAITGQEKQRFVLAKKEGTLTKILFHEFLETQTKRQVLIKFSEDSNYCYYAQKDCLGVLNIKNQKSKHIKIDGHILSIQETQDKKAIFVLSKKDDFYSISLIQNNDLYAGSTKFKAQNAFITVKENSLFVVKDSSISRIDIEYR
ncbi:hypothetical protein [Treponema pectinovorum]|uniref:hypothetical protein n=1 Tax=Treponema pectinovorum TaxID=164 RepID=UPI0011CCA366|nr:hypothetical protein [Treponema pectinovorum]